MRKEILVAPLNWGLGHATRCVPIINFLIKYNYHPIIASDGEALLFLQKEFPTLSTIELPSYNITYSKNLKIGLLFQFPKIVKAIRKEKTLINNLIAENKHIVGIISDNRFGVRSSQVWSVYLTHQIQVLSGLSTKITSWFHRRMINRFDECWVPDTAERTFSGKLSETNKLLIPVKFIGILSRFTKQKLPIENDILIVLSGIESQRNSLEKKLLEAFKNYVGNVVLVQGKIDDTQTEKHIDGVKVYNYLLSTELANEINKAALVICRSGYSSIMDLSALEKKAFFIPTTYQSEQEYLAAYLEKNKMVPFSNQKAFNLKQLNDVNRYSGLSQSTTKLSPKLFRFFKRK